MDTVDDFFANHPFVDNAGRRTFSAFFKKDRLMDLMIVNFENAASHKYVAQKGKNFWSLLHTWLCIHFLFLSKAPVNSFLNIPVALMSVWMPQGQYRAVLCNNDDVTTHNLLYWLIDYYDSTAQADILVNSLQLVTWCCP